MVALIKRGSPLRTIRGVGLLVLLSGAIVGGTGACNTDAVGVSECRDVEYARCEAAVPCGVIGEDEVESCKRFYRDHCLHGMRGDKVPTADDHNTCLEFIEDAEDRARMSLGMGGTGAADDDACDVIAKPWEYDECAYLATESSSMGGSE